MKDLTKYPINYFPPEYFSDEERAELEAAVSRGALFQFDPNLWETSQREKAEERALTARKIATGEITAEEAQREVSILSAEDARNVELLEVRNNSKDEGDSS